jgi:uncharacterized membrane protein
MPSFRKARSLLVPVTAGIGIAFPFLVYFGLQVLPPAALLAGLLGLVSLRLLLGRRTLYKPFVPCLWVAAGALFLLGLVAPLAALKAYPIFVSLGMAAVFGYSLAYPPSIIERLARFREPELPEAATSYLRNVTLIWFCFFLFNASISAWTALNENLDLWTLYNGFISYVLVGVLFAGEIVVRRYVRQGITRLP